MYRGHTGHVGTAGQSYITLQLLYIKGIQVASQQEGSGFEPTGQLGPFVRSLHILPVKKVSCWYLS